MKRSIYAIYDNVAQDIVGMLHIMAHDAVAVRLFTDIAAAPDTMINKHPEDHDLVSLGELDNNCNVIPNYRVIMTGLSWAASQDSEQDQPLALTGTHGARR